MFSRMKHCFDKNCSNTACSCTRDSQRSSVCLPNGSVILKSNTKWSRSSLNGRKLVTNDCTAAERSQTNHRWTEQAWWNEKGRLMENVSSVLLSASSELRLSLSTTVLLSRGPSPCFEPCWWTQLSLGLFPQAGLHDKRKSSNMPCAFCICKDEAQVCVFDLRGKRRPVKTAPYYQSASAEQRVQIIKTNSPVHVGPFILQTWMLWNALGVCWTLHLLTLFSIVGRLALHKKERIKSSCLSSFITIFWGKALSAKWISWAFVACFMFTIM